MQNIYWKRQAPILFSIVGQLKNSQTQIEGKIKDKENIIELPKDKEFECKYSIKF